MPPNAKSETEPEPAPVSGAEPASELPDTGIKEETTHHTSRFRENEQAQQAAESQRIAQVETTLAPKTTTEAEGAQLNTIYLMICISNLYMYHIITPCRSCYYLGAGY